MSALTASFLCELRGGLGLSGLPRRLLGLLAELADPATGLLAIRLKELADRAGATSKHTLNSLGVLKRKGLLRATQKGGDLYDYEILTGSVSMNDDDSGTEHNEPVVDAVAETSELAIRTVDGWQITDGAEPMVRDLELAERLGYEYPLNIRKLIRKHIDAGNISDSEVLSASEKTSSTGGRPGTAFWLTEAGALFVASQSGTPKAIAITKEVIKVFIAARRGELPMKRQEPADAMGLAVVSRLALDTSERLAGIRKWALSSATDITDLRSDMVGAEHTLEAHESRLDSAETNIGNIVTHLTEVMGKRFAAVEERIAKLEQDNKALRARLKEAGTKLSAQWDKSEQTNGKAVQS
jgi:hypothetical protein